MRRPPVDPKRRPVRRRPETGQPPAAALRETRAEYDRRRRQSLLRGRIVDWLTDRLTVTGSGRSHGRR